MFQCQECGRKFRTTKAAERAVDVGCPKCGGTDIDVSAGGAREPEGYGRNAVQPSRDPLEVELALARHIDRNGHREEA